MAYHASKNLQNPYLSNYTDGGYYNFDQLMGNDQHLLDRDHDRGTGVHPTELLVTGHSRSGWTYTQETMQNADQTVTAWSRINGGWNDPANPASALTGALPLRFGTGTDGV